MTAALYLQPSAWAFGRGRDSSCRALVRRLWFGPLQLSWWASTPTFVPPEERRIRRSLLVRRLFAAAWLLAAMVALVAAGMVQ